MRSLHQKKYRQMYGKFLVEGEKLVHEVLHSDVVVESIFATPEAISHLPVKRSEVYSVSETELSKISTHETPNKMVAVALQPNWPALPQPLPDGLYLVLDGINDPGNLGTIMRTADWFGIDTVLLSENCVEVYNPKTVSAAKGSLFRVKSYTVNIPDFLAQNNQLPVYGTFMNGQSVYTSHLSKSGLIIIGNEANGISTEVAKAVTQRVGIPAIGKAESLNAAVATGIILSEFARRTG